MTDLNTLRATLRRRTRFRRTLVLSSPRAITTSLIFNNGGVENAAGRTKARADHGSWRLLEGLSDEEALLAFGEHYRSVVPSLQAVITATFAR